MDEILSCVCLNEQHQYAIRSYSIKNTMSPLIDSTTHSSSFIEIKSTLVQEVIHYWDTTTPNCMVKACPTIFIHRELPVSKEGQQVLDTLNGSTIGSKVEGSG